MALDFDSEDSVGVRLKAHCSSCNRESLFKLNVSSRLRPA